MANIKISELNPAGSDLFASADSFLTELQDIDTAQILGGSGKKGKSRKGSGKRKSGRSGRGSGRGGNCFFPCNTCH